MTIKHVLAAGAILTLALSGCSEPASTAEANPQEAAAGHEAAIRAVNDRWLNLIGQRDAAAIAALYTEDGVVMPAGMPLSQGPEAVAETWRGLMALPGFDLTFAPEQILVASGGDMAMDRGTYRLTTAGPDGPVVEDGKYVVVWRNVGGDWKVAADIFNSNAPPPAPAEAEAPAT